MVRLRAVISSMKQSSMIRSQFVGQGILSLLLLSTAGCQQKMAADLLGEWEGRPDTAAARAKREAEKYGDKPSDDPNRTSENAREKVTDWEQYDIAVKFNFVSRTQLEMSLADGTEPRSGTWQILETSPTGCIIEVETATGPEQSPEARHFQLEMDERDSTLFGFLLTEVGADRQLGALYFRRPDSAE